MKTPVKPSVKLVEEGVLNEVMPHIHNLDDGLFHRNPRRAPRSVCREHPFFGHVFCVECLPRYRLVAVQALANLGPKAVHTRKAGMTA